jgi:hypothetical protein
MSPESRWRQPAPLPPKWKMISWPQYRHLAMTCRLRSAWKVRLPGSAYVPPDTAENRNHRGDMPPRGVKTRSWEGRCPPSVRSDRGGRGGTTKPPRSAIYGPIDRPMGPVFRPLVGLPTVCCGVTASRSPHAQTPPRARPREGLGPPYAPFGCHLSGGERPCPLLRARRVGWQPLSGRKRITVWSCEGHREGVESARHAGPPDAGTSFKGADWKGVGRTDAGNGIIFGLQSIGPALDKAAATSAAQASAASTSSAVPAGDAHITLQVNGPGHCASGLPRFPDSGAAATKRAVPVIGLS